MAEFVSGWLSVREVPSSISRYELIPSVKIKAALKYPLNGALMERRVKRAHHRPHVFLVR